MDQVRDQKSFGTQQQAISVLFVEDEEPEPAKNIMVGMTGGAIAQHSMDKEGTIMSSYSHMGDEVIEVKAFSRRKETIALGGNIWAPTPFPIGGQVTGVVKFYDTREETPSWQGIIPLSYPLYDMQFNCEWNDILIASGGMCEFGTRLHKWAY